MGVNINWLLSGEGTPWGLDILDKKITDKIVIKLFHNLLDIVVTPQTDLFSKDEKITLFRYLARNTSKGLDEAVDLLFEGGEVREFEDLMEWGKCLHDIAREISGSTAVEQDKRKRRKGRSK